MYFVSFNSAINLLAHIDAVRRTQHTLPLYSLHANCLYLFIWMVRYARKLLIWHLSKMYGSGVSMRAFSTHCTHKHSINILLNGWSIDRINRLSVLLFFMRYILRRVCCLARSLSVSASHSEKQSNSVTVPMILLPCFYALLPINLECWDVDCWSCVSTFSFNQMVAIWIVNEMALRN